MPRMTVVVVDDCVDGKTERVGVVNTNGYLEVPTMVVFGTTTNKASATDHWDVITSMKTRKIGTTRVRRRRDVICLFSNKVK
jgi:predicted SnoaL-like aldol condensation-catalyzing enzyme